MTECHVDVAPQSLMGRSILGEPGYVTEERVRRRMIDSDTGLRPVRVVTSVLRMWSCQRILAIWRWHFIWNASKRLVSAADSVHVSQAYVRTGRTSIWYTRTLVGKDRYW